MAMFFKTDLEVKLQKMINNLLGVLRYIHNNPVKAKIVDDMLKYKQNSANDYANNNADLVSKQFLIEILDLFKNKDDFIKFHNISDDSIY